MHVAGIHSHVKDGRAVVAFVVLRREAAGWVEHACFIHVCDPQEELPQRLLNLSDALPHLLDNLDLRAVVLRDRDYAPGNQMTALKHDFTADGVVLAEARRRCAIVEILPGSRIGDLCGSNKATAEKEAAAAFGRRYAEAGAAANAAAALT